MAFSTNSSMDSTMVYLEGRVDMLRFVLSRRLHGVERKAAGVVRHLSGGGAKTSTMISGGGIAGLTLSLLLRSKGHSTTIVELAKGFDTLLHTPTKCLVVPASGVALYKRLGVDLQTKGSEMKHIWIVDQDGEGLAKIDLGPASAIHGHAPYIALPWGALHRSLLEKHGPVSMKMSVKSVKELQDGRLECRVKAGTGKQIVDYLVGADGVASQTRANHWSHEGVEMVFPGYGMWQAIVPKPKGFFYGDTAVEMWGRNKRRIGFIPISDSDLYVYGTKATDLPKQVDADRVREEFVGHFSEFRGHGVRDILDTILQPEIMVHFDYPATIRTKNASRGRIALVGDAAHALPESVFCESMTLAVEDAKVLAAVIEEGGCLSEYDARRLERVKQVQQLALSLYSAPQSATEGWGVMSGIKRAMRYYVLKQTNNMAKAIAGEP